MGLVSTLSIALFCVIGVSLCFANDTFDETLNNRGVCPPINWLSSCKSPIIHNCAVDVDCGFTNKCCYNGCYMTCKAPYGGNVTWKPEACIRPVDLAFMIDSSESFGRKNFEHVKKMVHKTLNMFSVSEKNTHVSVIVIDSVPHVELKFNTLKGNSITSDNVMKVVYSLQFIRGQTRIDLAMRMAQKEVFSKAGGARKDALKILLVFTDGVQTWDPRTMFSLSKLSNRLVKTGVQIFPVAIWNHELNIGTLRDIASCSNNIFNAEFYPYLLGLLKQITKGPCSGDPKKKIWKRVLESMTKVE